jgi:hypothetical protein
MAGDDYVWSGPLDGSWDDPSQWTDETADQTPAAVAPGSNDLVTINGPSNLTQIVSGAGAAASLTTSGEVAFTGQITTGALTDGGSLTLSTGAGLTVSGDATLQGAQVTADGGSFSAGAVNLQDGSLTSEAGGSVQVGAITVSGFGVLSVEDSSSSLPLRSCSHDWPVQTA